MLCCADLWELHVNFMCQSTPMTVQVLEVVDCLASALGALAVVLLVTPAVLIAAVPLVFFYVKVQNYYIATNRELKRLDSINLSPIFSKFSETLSGLMTLRAFEKEDQFQEQNKALIDESNRAWWPMQVCMRRFISSVIASQCFACASQCFAVVVHEAS